MMILIITTKPEISPKHTFATKKVMMPVDPCKVVMDFIKSEKSHKNRLLVLIRLINWQSY